MNRYKITFINNKSLLLYAPNQSALNLTLYEKELGEIQSVTQYTDNSHEKYISKIKQKSEFIGNMRNYELYKCKYNKGYMLVFLAKDKEDNTYYDIAEYMEYKDNRFLEPVTKTLSSPKEIYDMISQPEPQYIIYSHRYYGEPKLSKPKELKGIKSIGKATFIPNHCSPQIYIKDNDVYIKHTDYFSSSWKPPKEERIDMPLSYYANKYFNKKDTKNKFIYPDCWGDIVLRNEAWILLKDILLIIQTENNTMVARKILDLQKHDKYSCIDTSNENEWLIFWENVCKYIKEKI